MANLFRCAGAGGEDIKCIERPYNSNDIYNTGDTAMYNSLLRICLADGVTGDFNESKWEVTTLDELLGENIGENDALVDYIASEYDPTHTYTAGDAILGDNAEILKCLADGVTGEFDKSKWGRDYLCNLSGNVNSNLMNLKSFKVTTEKNVFTQVTLPENAKKIIIYITDWAATIDQVSGTAFVYDVENDIALWNGNGSTGYAQNWSKSGFEVKDLHSTSGTCYYI